MASSRRRKVAAARRSDPCLVDRARVNGRRSAASKGQRELPLFHGRSASRAAGCCSHASGGATITPRARARRARRSSARSRVSSAAAGRARARSMNFWSSGSVQCRRWAGATMASSTSFAIRPNSASECTLKSVSPARVRDPPQYRPQLAQHRGAGNPAHPAGLHGLRQRRRGRVAEHPQIEHHVGVQHEFDRRHARVLLPRVPTNIMEGFSADFAALFVERPRPRPSRRKVRRPASSGALGNYRRMSGPKPVAVLETGCRFRRGRSCSFKREPVIYANHQPARAPRP